jgi:hypothetical protein
MVPGKLQLESPPFGMDSVPQNHLQKDLKLPYLENKCLIKKELQLLMVSSDLPRVLELL